MDARYNRSLSGWFEMPIFEDWFNTLPLPYLKKLRGKKMVIEDNLSFNLSSQVTKSCEENHISFILLPPNSTHFMKPFNVSFFFPLKIAWKKILKKTKTCL